MIILAGKRGRVKKIEREFYKNLVENNFMNNNDIESFPDISYEKCSELYNAVQEDRLIVFIGAGVSRLTGCLGWVELAKKLVSECRKRNLFTYIQAEFLLSEAMNNPRKTISICNEKCKMKKGLVDSVYYKVIKSSISIKKRKKLEIYRLILQLKARAYITTNIDAGIFQFNPVVTGQKIFNCTSLGFKDVVTNQNIIKDGNIIFLHGRGDEQSIRETIFSVDQYIEHYRKEYINKFLKEQVFNNKNVILFIGYGINEWEILEYLVLNAGEEISQKIPKKSPNRYVLAPIFSSEIIKSELDKMYFRIFYIQTLPYFIDNQGYDKLFEVLKNLNKNISNYKPKTSEMFNKIDEIVKDESE